MDFKNLTKKKGREIINFKLEHDINWLTRGLIAIYSLQTEDEKIGHQTKHENKVGFSHFDSEFLTSLARQVKQKKQNYPNKPEFWLTDKQKEILVKKMKRYSGQLLKIARGEIDYIPEQAQEPKTERKSRGWSSSLYQAKVLQFRK